MPNLTRTSTTQARRASVSRRPAGARINRAAQILRQPAEDWTPAQVQHLQQQVGNRAVTQRLTTGSSPAVQRVIAVRTGERYAAAGELPGPLQASPLLTGLANAAETSLAQSVADLTERANGRAAPILTADRHLIGENHDNSRFDEAVTAWGWGAAKMEEGFQTSAMVTDPYTQSWLHPGRFQSRTKVGTLPLEDVHARMLQDIALYRFRVNILRQAADGLHLDVGLNRLRAEDKTQYNTVRSNAEDQKGDLLVRMKGYETACTQIRQQDQALDTPPQAALRGMANAMHGQWTPLRNRMTFVASSPWNWVFADSGDMGVAEKLRLRAVDAQTLMNDLDALATHAMNVLKAEEPGKQGVADTALGDVTAGRHPLNSVSPLREAFMQDKINAAPRPVLVRMGAAHVGHLNGHINNGQYHNSYNDFVAAIRGP